MAKFINVPPLDIAPEAEQWILTESCIYQSDLFEPLIEVPVNFITDLASIPRIFRFLIVKNGKHRAAAIVHDFLCRLGKGFDRVLADKIFLKAMLLSGERRVRARLMYWAVSLNTKRMKLMGKA